MQPTALHLAEQIAELGVQDALDRLAAAQDVRSAWLIRRSLARRKAALLLLGSMRLVLDEPSPAPADIPACASNP